MQTTELYDLIFLKVITNHKKNVEEGKAHLLAIGPWM